MADMMEYKCPACGGALAFDSASQKLRCPFCGTEYDISELESEAVTDESIPDPGEENTGSMKWSVEPGSQWGEEEGKDVKIYICNSCGGEIVCQETTSSTSCPYCGNPVVLKGQLSGELKPDYVIPFKLDKKAAKEALKNHVSSKKLVPSLFKSENHIDEIKGVYIPFWLFDAEVAANINYMGERTRSWSDKKYDYVEHNFYRINRAGYVAFDHVPVDGSEKMADDLMESIEPFDFKDAVDFQTAYLAGYIADKYDVDAKASIETANQRIRRSTEDAFRETVNGYGVVTTQGSHIDLKNGIAKYALYPVWLLNTKWQGKTYTFAMNGQTGKFVGDLPMDKGAYWKKFGILAAACSAAAFGIAVLISGLF